MLYVICYPGHWANVITGVALYLFEKILAMSHLNPALSIIKVFVSSLASRQLCASNIFISSLGSMSALSCSTRHCRGAILCTDIYFWVERSKCLAQEHKGVMANLHSG